MLLEDVPQLVFVSVFGRLDTGRQSSAISLVGASTAGRTRDLHADCSLAYEVPRFD